MTDPFQLSQPIVEVYEACVDELLVNLARHFNVKATGPTASFSYETRMLAKFGAINRESAAIIARHVAGADEMVRLAVEQAMLEAIADEEPALQEAARQGIVHGTSVPVQESIQARLTAYSRQAIDQLNLVNTVMLDGTWQAYQAGVYQAADVLRQLDTAQTVLNQETGKVITGVSSRQQAVRSAVKKMADAGITGFIDHGGHRWSPEAYVRMDIKTTCSNAARQAVFDRNRDYGNDLVWVRVNATARPGCYPWQGKVISTEGRSGMTHDLDDKPIPFYSIHDTTYGQPDGLWGINCHHGPPNVFLPGLSSIRGEVPSADDNAAAYELTQRQRQLERQVRYAKREAAMLDAAGDKEGFDQAALRVKQRQQALRDFAEANNLPLSGDRTQVMVYNRSVAGKAAAVSAKYSRYHYSKDGTIVVTDDWKDRKHASPPGTYKPYAVMETVSGKHRQVDRTFYDAHGVILRQVHSKAHLKWQHPDYANGGAHAHDYISGKRIDYDGKDGRELTESEVTENADIIDAAGVERSPV